MAVLLRFLLVAAAGAVLPASAAVDLQSGRLRRGLESPSIKDPMWHPLDKKMPLKAQEQGFTGEKVKHVDGKTKTGDWHNEYPVQKPSAPPPPPAPQRSVAVARWATGPLVLLLPTLTFALSSA
eukprot:TRINITY_DN33405_c0_g1_i1.p1 TRINITY_DN33405_c0_g1~~TRINITY_DN33405_c0_g1_i1.p1  ORF type:complete len:145 (+),score=22.81 TRINITY_DN33405_c0_g1_i1:66-437(+)